MTQATGYVTYRVDFSYDESKYEKERALQEVIDNSLLSTDNIKVCHKQMTISVT